MKALCAGSFDPVTVGHYDYISRVAKLFDSVVVAVTDNTEKRYMFTAEERLRYLKQAFAGLDNVCVVAYDGWTADVAKLYGADVIVKGVRNNGDFEYEKLISAVNLDANGIETLLIPCDGRYADVCSSTVRERIKYGKPFMHLIPQGVEIEKREE